MGKHHSERLTIVPTRVYSRAEVAEILNVSMSTVKRLLASGQLRASQPPGLRRVFITGQAILEMLTLNEQDPILSPVVAREGSPDRDTG